MFVQNPRLLLMMSIGLFTFGVGFGFLAFPKFLRHMIKSVSECVFSLNASYFQFDVNRTISRTRHKFPEFSYQNTYFRSYLIKKCDFRYDWR